MGPIWDYPAAANDACVLMVSRFLFCCRIAPRRERTQWSPAAVEREALPCSVLCRLSVCLQTLSLFPAPFLPKPPGMGPLQLCSALISSSFGIWSRGGGVYTSFSPDLGESGLHPLDRLGMGKQRLDRSRPDAELRRPSLKVPPGTVQAAGRGGGQSAAPAPGAVPLGRDHRGGKELLAPPHPHPGGGGAAWLLAQT